MARIEKTVFISYRRKDISWALAVYQYLTAKKYDVFFDFTNISSGDFEQSIIGNIKARAHFILILTPSALNRCSNADDWLRREIETAIDEKRNIIPLLFDGFNFSSPDTIEKLSGKLSSLKKYNGLEIPYAYFGEAMERLHSRYLAIALDTVLHPVPIEVGRIAKEQKDAADKAALFNGMIKKRGTGIRKSYRWKNLWRYRIIGFLLVAFTVVVIGGINLLSNQLDLASSSVTSTAVILETNTVFVVPKTFSATQTPSIVTKTPFATPTPVASTVTYIATPIVGVPRIIYVDPDYVGAEEGTEDYPYNTLEEGQSFAQSLPYGGWIFLKSDTSWEKIYVSPVLPGASGGSD
ncbi:MAG: toll/interleukin-1 receptor domain-containing protein [Anaerolineae bacterium]|jgi:hypothetical protein|nr:toll/interleukin-1 receptor domain-containing protein [Anaerolineae bacterium]MBT7191142.1 toll/interleukin-1 receptor domain-containing protein [Anaerolineae bacterium]MBT7988306.1 toll/interleukin-1 receptor domain-containing protein [Anaerolineae bacterium]